MRQKRLQRVPTDPAEIAALCRVVARDLADAAVPAISEDARVGIAYDAARSTANIALRASGYRLRGLRSHETTFEALGLIRAAWRQHVAYFQLLRRKRNALTYATAGEMSETEAAEALTWARVLAAEVQDWLRREHPELVGG